MCVYQAWGQARKGLSPLDLSPPLIKGLKSGLGLKPFIDVLQALLKPFFKQIRVKDLSPDLSPLLRA